MEFIKIGKVLKTHGFKGHLKIYVDEFYMNDFEDINSVIINNLPYFISSKDINSNSHAIILLEDIDSKEKAQKLQGKELLAKEDDLTEILDGNEFDDIVTYVILDKNYGEIGKINEIVEMPFQIMAKVTYKEKPILIPLNDDFITLINDKKKTVEMQLPDGFLEIF